MLSFSRIAFYHKACKNIITSLESAALENVSKFCTNCARWKDDISEQRKTGNSRNVADKNELDSLQNEIRAANRAHKKAMLEMEAEMMGKRYAGSYRCDGALHVPVLQEEVLSCFEQLKNKSSDIYLKFGHTVKPSKGEVIQQGQTVLDMTFGAGGHTKALLERVPGCHILALDRDPTANDLAKELSKTLPGSVTPLLGRFSDLPGLLASVNVKPNSIGGVLMDLGTSSMQFDQSERGFSLSMNGPLDMRMDMSRIESMPTAADVVNSLGEEDLSLILKKYGEETRASNISHAIVEARAAYGRITTTHQLADIVEAACRGGYGKDKLGRSSHPAIKTFQALRIFVNNELNELDIGLRIAHKFLEIGGICVAIGFHSLEEKLIKHHFYGVHLQETHEKYFKHRQFLRTHRAGVAHTIEEMEKLSEKKWKPFEYGAFTPKEEELLRNPRSRSAIMYAAKKLSKSWKT